jgi:Dimerisation and cyclophilin-binding domain of Mon2
MGCATKNVKVITIALGSLQRLIALRAVSLSAIPAIIQTMNDCMSQGVDIQLKILQTLLSLITNFPTIHGGLLADVRVLWFSILDQRTEMCYALGPAFVLQVA